MVAPVARPHALREDRAWTLLQEVKDPEIPTVSVLELGLIRSVKQGPAAILVELMPTFLGCPAIEAMQQMIREQLAELGTIDVKLVTDEPWTTSRITEQGREKLRCSGFAPPPRGDSLELHVLQPHARCPYCDSSDTMLESSFGPTLCRAVHYCKACRSPFEQFKAI